MFKCQSAFVYSCEISLSLTSNGSPDILHSESQVKIRAVEFWPRPRAFGLGLSSRVLSHHRHNLFYSINT